MIYKAKDSKEVLDALIQACQSGYEGNSVMPRIFQNQTKYAVKFRTQGFEIENPIWKEIKQWAEIQTNDIEVSSSGICGMIDWEPLIEVTVPGKKTVVFAKVSIENVVAILDGMINHIIVADEAIAQKSETKGELWSRLPKLYELTQLSGQSRSILYQADQADSLNLSQHIINGGFHALTYSLLHRTPDDVVKLIRQSGLIGRGGAGYLVADKWEIAKDTSSDERYIICNINEFGPHSITGKVLAESNPFGIIESIILAAYATNSGKAIIFIHSAYTQAIQLLENAIKQCRLNGLLGEDIIGSGININISVVQAPGMIITGEETALISMLEGNRPVPKIKPPFPANHGLLGKPTIIHNVETLANIIGILTPFSDFAAIANQPTKLVTLSGRIKHTGLYEVPIGMSFREIIFNLGGGMADGHQFKAFQFGGPSGYLYAETDLDRTIDFGFIAKNQVYIGTASLVVLSESDCLVDFVQFNLMILREESCGKCVPCREGSRVLHDTLQSVTRKSSSKNHEVLERFKQVVALGEVAETMRNTSFCSLGQNLPNMMLSLFTHFRDELEEHVFDRHCRALVCQGLRIYSIKTNLCTGCGACHPVCPVNAIAGNTIDRFYILENECIGCGKCVNACRFGAIYIK